MLLLSSCKIFLPIPGEQTEEDNSNTTIKKLSPVCLVVLHTENQSCEKTTSLKNVNHSKKQHDLHAESQFCNNIFLSQGLDHKLSKTESRVTTILEGLRFLNGTCSHKEKT